MKFQSIVWTIVGIIYCLIPLSTGLQYRTILHHTALTTLNLDHVNMNEYVVNSSSCNEVLVLKPSKYMERAALVLDYRQFLVFMQSNPFDKTLKTTISQMMIRSQLVESLFPEPYINSNISYVKDIILDMVSSVNLMTSFLHQQGVDNMTLRLAVVNGVRCPKWHEDYVDTRLIKSYFGNGPQWIDPNDYSIRFVNFIRSLIYLDHIVWDERKIRHTPTGMAIIIGGRKRANRIRYAVPVLHRSPVEKEITSQRLLFTITID
eukprot:gene15408-20787_t